MRGLLYLNKTIIKNRILKALRKPVTYIYAVFIIGYIILMLFGISGMFVNMKLDNPEGMVLILSLFTIIFTPLNFMSYSKRKGLVFRPSDVHFLFVSPINPKLFILFALVKNLIMSILLLLVLIPCGIFLCHIPVWKMVLYFLFSIIFENVLECSMVILLYGNERFSEATIKQFCNIIKLVLLALIGYIVYTFLTGKPSVELAYSILKSPFILGIPVVGWIISFYRLLLIGPTLFTAICTGLYLMSVFLFSVMAVKMKCTGEYFENAMKYADDYDELQKKSKKGEIALLGHRKKFKKSNIVYKGNYSRAIFYRQLLEYKKSKTYIFGLNTLICLAVGILGAIFIYKNDITEYKMFIIPGIAAYFQFIFSGYPTKWAKELDNPYTFLIPDTPMRKLWNATVIEHIRAIIDSLLITIPIAVVLKLTPFQALIGALIYVCLQANKLYTVVLCEALLGNVLGNFAKQMLKFFFQSICIGIGILGAIVGALVGTVEIGFVCMILVTAFITFLVAFGASLLFDRMETID